MFFTYKVHLLRRMGKCNGGANERVRACVHACVRENKKERERVHCVFEIESIEYYYTERKKMIAVALLFV